MALDTTPSDLAALHLAADKAIALCGEVALSPLPEAWDRLTAATRALLDALIGLALAGHHDRVDELVDAQRRMIDTLVSRRMAELGELH